MSFVIPAYNAAETIGMTVRSILFPRTKLPSEWDLEIIVIDDGSEDGTAAAIAQRSDVMKVLRHQHNRGKCAATNTGLAASMGDIVIVLDADDEMIEEWPMEFAGVLREWPAEVQVCYCMCRNDRGELTTRHRGDSVLLSVDDLLNERYAGEYLPCFRGRYIRRRGYVDLGLLKRPCLVVSYLGFVLEGPFWVSNKVLRKYHDRRPGSITRNFTEMRKAEDMARCYEVLLARFGDLYRARAPLAYRQKLLRYAVYLSLAGRPGAWAAWFRGVRLSCLSESVGALLALLLGRRFCAAAVNAGKRMGLIRQYG